MASHVDAAVAGRDCDSRSILARIVSSILSIPSDRDQVIESDHHLPRKKRNGRAALLCDRAGLLLTDAEPIETLASKLSINPSDSKRTRGTFSS